MENNKLFIKSYGCQMNVYDSARMADVLMPAGFVVTDDQEAADLIILNTCHIREKAAEKVYSELGRLRSKYRIQDGSTRNGPLVGVAGCVAQAEGEEILRRAPNVDFVVGPQSYHKLPALVLRALETANESNPSSETRLIETDFPAESKFDQLGNGSSQGPSAFLTVQEGCDKFCSFCVVPYTRGAEYSRPSEQVLDEARFLIDGGAREITLLGQNVNAYHGSDQDLASLIYQLADIEGLDRIRYMTSHPKDMSATLIRAHAEVPKLMPYLHLPVQSGSNQVLGRMNRGHKVKDYLAIIDSLRRAQPNIALSSDFIVGHPGETEAEFQETLTLVRQVGYAQAYSFKYSERPGTPASEALDPVPEEIKADRLSRLQALLKKQQLECNLNLVGTVQPVLFDRPGKYSNQIAGRCPQMQAVYLDLPSEAVAVSIYGSIIEVEILSAHANSLKGCLTNATIAALEHKGVELVKI